MKVVRKLALGLLLAGALTYAAISAQTQDQASPVHRYQNANQADFVAQTSPEFRKAGEPAPPPGADAESQLTYPSNRSQLQPQSAQLAKQYVEAKKDDEKKELRKKLTEALTELFDQHIQAQQKELEELDKQIAALKGVLKKRLEAKTAIVERRIEQLIQDAEGLGWNAPSGPGTRFVPLNNMKLP